MFADHIRTAILALAECDGEATEADKERVALALNGSRPRGAIIRIAKAAGMLGVHSNTIRNWCKTGRLDPVAGANGRIIGVTEQSLSKI